MDPLVTTKWLKNKLNSDPSGVQLLDCQWHYGKDEKGEEEYKKNHIPGALFFDLLACADKDSDIQMMLPKPEQFADYVGKLGIKKDTRIVLYDNNEKYGLFSAARVWWTFRIMGHPDELISILDGGLPAWLKAGYETNDSVPSVDIQVYEVSFQRHLLKSFEEIRSNLKDQKATMVDARFNHVFQARGNVAGAKNIPFTNLLDSETKLFKSHQDVKEQFEAAGVNPNKPLVASCALGVVACVLALGAYVCGNKDVAVYDGSWAEWSKKASADEIEGGQQQ